jgi:hypothetical protein
LLFRREPVARFKRIPMRFSSLPLIPIIFISAACAPSAFAATLHVPADHPTIQSCIDAAVSGQDECAVAPGTYNELINFLGKAITLRSSHGPEVTTIDGTGLKGSIVMCVSGETSESIFEGFTVTGGSGSGTVDIFDFAGGGFYNLESSPTIKNCVFENNLAYDFGGGIGNAFSSPTIEDCVFNHNSSNWSWGGGIANYLSHPIIKRCTFLSNSASFGGGIYNELSNPTITGCVFREHMKARGGGIDNVASSPTVIGCLFADNTGGIEGGGMNNEERSNPTVASCNFSGNWAGAGGGMYNSDDSSPTLINCQFVGNGASTGGAIHNGHNPYLARDSKITIIDVLRDRSLTANQGTSATDIRNCMFIGNWGEYGGGGIFNYGESPVVTNSTFAGNSTYISGGGMVNAYGSPTVANCMFIGNVAGSNGGAMATEEGDPRVINCTLSENVALKGTGGGIASYLSNMILTNCIIRGNFPDETLFYTDAPVPTATFSNIQGGVPAHAIDGGGNFDLDPMFVRHPSDGGDGWDDNWTTPEVEDGPNDDYGDVRLQPGSPCINAGDPDLVPSSGETDLDGHARALCGRVDMGAYEFGIGDFDCNQAINLRDVAGLQTCFTGDSAAPYNPGCENLDFEFDGDVDLPDLAQFLLIANP